MSWSPRILTIIAVFALVLFSTQGRGQTPTSQVWNNSSGDFTWNQQGNTTTNKGFNDWTNSASSGTWNGGFDNPTFGTTGAGTITIDDSGTGGAVTAEALLFSGGNHTFSGDALYRYSSSATAGGEVFIQVGGSGTIIFNAPIVFGDFTGGNQQAYVNLNSGTTLSFSNLDFGPEASTASRRLNLNANGSTISLNGAVTASGGHGGQLNITGNGTYNLNSGADFTNFTGGAINSYATGGATINFYTSKFLSSQTIGINSSTGTFNINGAQTIPLAIYDSTKHGSPQASDGVNITYGVVMNQVTADLSTWSGSTNLDGSNMTLTAVAGGRLVMNGSMNGDAPAGLVIGGAGVVVLGAGNSYDERDGNGNLQPTSTVAATLKTGSTTLITNTTGSAFGHSTNGSSYYNNVGTYNFPVQVQSGATLGGTGISTVTIQALAADSLIAPGDPGQSNLGIASSIGTLHLNGGIVATNGLTMDFKLNGLAYDSIDFGGTSTVTGATLNLDNVITFNLTGTPVISAANNNGVYKILTGLDLRDSMQGSNLQFVFNAPTGYEVTSWSTASGTTPGKNDYLYVQLALAPEPSTYGLFALGLVGLIAIRRFRRLDA